MDKKEIKIKKFVDNEIVIDEKTVYVTSENKTLHTDLSKAKVEGYVFSHQEDDVYIYNPM